MASAESIARVCHEANRAWQLESGDPHPSPRWEEAPQWQRDSAIEGVRRARAGASPEQLHESWCEHKRGEGWRYGPVKDAERRTHPCLVRYGALPEAERRKDALFAAVVAALEEGMV
ncbi:RyR domain-containing protein [Streptomyces smyrnaeus]|uniref:RyR domain-containing protein n=1 Tax=Streptomyces smyrnaeus TaxID=1387713 RepID=UPI0036833381